MTNNSAVKQQVVTGGEACSVVPSHLRGGLGRGAWKLCTLFDAPPPNLPRKGGGTPPLHHRAQELRAVSLLRMAAAPLLLATILSGCSLSPDFEVPKTELSESFKAQADAKGVWKEAVSLENDARGEWWKVFGDATLDGLEKQAIEANQSLKAAAARVEQARGKVRANAASFLPNVDIGGNAVRAKAADASTAGFSSGPAARLKPYTLYSADATASYDADVFGRVRDNEKALESGADAEEALYRNTLLALQADVAQHYFLLAALDAERALLKTTVAMRTEAKRIMQKRLDAGAVDATDLSRTENDLADAQAAAIALDRQRAVLENALAILLGQNPSSYHFPETAQVAMPPHIPAGIPSELLQRRPDIAAAQANMAAANKRIGVARTAFFPSLLLTVTGGFQSTDLENIFAWSSRSWALGQTAGSALAMNLFDSGRNFGNLDAAHAAYDESVANYRQQVLVAMGDVENTLSDQRLLAEQSRAQDDAAKAAAKAFALTQKRYDAGDVDYFQLVETQRSMLAANRAAIQTRGARMVATVALIRALGGGWDAATLQGKGDDSASNTP